MEMPYSPDTPKSAAVLIRAPRSPFVGDVVSHHEEGMFPVLESGKKAIKICQVFLSEGSKGTKPYKRQ